MTKNLRGGKAHKRFKKVPTDIESQAGKFVAREEYQDYARVLRMLGDRRVACFCNDAKERICKIRQALCKGPGKQKIEVDDIVLISFREFENDGNGIADLINKFHREHWRDIRKEENIHKDLFLSSKPIVGVANNSTLEDLFNYEGTDGKAESNKIVIESESESDIDSDAIDAI